MKLENVEVSVFLLFLFSEGNVIVTLRRFLVFLVINYRLSSSSLLDSPVMYKEYYKKRDNPRLT